VARVPLRVQQFTFHPKNANQVWPGTFGLADFLLGHEDRCALTNGRRRAPHRAAKARGRVGGEELSPRTDLLYCHEALALSLPLRGPGWNQYLLIPATYPFLFLRCSEQYLTHPVPTLPAGFPLQRRSPLEP